jgi:hypothetical protein
MGEGKTLLVAGRTPPETDFRLYRLADDGSKPVPVTDAPLLGFGPLQVSKDGCQVAALDANQRPIIVSLRDGATLSVPAGHNAVPRGWAPDGTLWLSEGGDHAPARLRLFRVDLRTGNVLEERFVSRLIALG